jgi:hypothetical protein
MKQTGGFRLALLAGALVGFAPVPGQAQFQGGTGFAPPPAQFAPAAGPSVAPAAPPPGGAMTMRTPPGAGTLQGGGSQTGTPQPQTTLTLSARFGRDFPQPISNGLIWRVYQAKPDPSRPLKPIREERTATPMMTLPSGDYVVHVAFGLVSAVRNVSLRSETAKEVFDLPAGGIRLEGRVGDARIPSGQITFDVYPGSQFDVGEKKPLAEGVMTGDVVVVPEGTYNVVSNYGDSNAQVRSDIRVQVGKLTDAVVNHHAAVMVLKLVTERGGEALANTEWTVLTPGGDVVKESIGAFPKVILAEGEYRAIARNEGRTYERAFKVTTGLDGEIEVLAQ